MISEEHNSLLNSLGFQIVDFLSALSCYVYKVLGEDNNHQIAKMAVRDSWGVAHVSKENQVLEILSGENSLEGIPKKTMFEICDKSYGASRFSETRIAVLVKEYIDGKLMSDGDGINKQEQKALRRLIEQIHQIGMVNLDIKSNNIVISNQGQPYIIDLGTVNFRNQISKCELDFNQRQDYDSLEQLFTVYGV